MPAYIPYVTIAIMVAVNLSKELSRDLMMLQQNSYRNERYRRWLSASGDTTSPWRLSALVIFLLSLSGFGLGKIAISLMGIFAIVHTVTLAGKKYKKPLVWTRRSLRIYTVSILISVMLCAEAVIIFDTESLVGALHVAIIAIFGLYCASHIVILLSNTLLSPVEKAINRRYYDDAAMRLASMPDLKIIGITGSYGKTSTKHYLHRILSEQFDTLMTPGSFNTTLGVVRTIREHLKPYNEVFIVEMGAKQIGDIKEICDLVKPQMAIVTAVGPQHLESFKTIENVQRTKFELVDALPDEGFAVLNNDFEMIATRSVDNVDCLRYAVTSTDCADLVAEEISYSASGTDFTARGRDGWSLRLHTRLVGECNISNLLAAVAIAHRLGMADDRISYAVGQIEQVEHRLSVKRTPGGVVIIDDAFNSNPVGSAMALDVLSGMKGGRRIVVTPGMIELGERTDELNGQFGEKIASSADIAFVVGRYNREAIVAGIIRGGMSADSLIVVDSFAEAQKKLAGMLRAGDTVLYENDLPDTFK